MNNKKGKNRNPDSKDTCTFCRYIGSSLESYQIKI